MAAPVSAGAVDGERAAAGIHTRSAESQQAPDLAQLLERHAGRARSRRRLLFWLGFVVLGLLGGSGYAWYTLRQVALAPVYVTETVRQGTLTVTVSATGRLQPLKQVEVGSELSGIIAEVVVEENDRVGRGQRLASLDTARLEDAVAGAEAALSLALARERQAEASLAQAGSTLRRLQSLGQYSAAAQPTASELEAAETDLQRAEADTAAARASVAQARADLRSVRTNLNKAQIRSPIEGVVLSRQVEPGQTVAASLQAPVLFTLAEDLARMELQVDVDEADVGQVAVGQAASFGVDAWPGRRYEARITRIGFGAQEKDGVVTYPARLSVDNQDLTLRPGMTATAEITTLVKPQVLLIPNTALRFTPEDAAAPRAADRRGILGFLLPRPPHAPARAREAEADPRSRQVWVLRDGVAVAVAIRTGAGDGRVTEVSGGELVEGEKVITAARYPNS